MRHMDWVLNLLQCMVLCCILHSIQSPHDLVMSTPDQTLKFVFNFTIFLGLLWVFLDLLPLWFLLLVSQGSQVVVEMWCCESSGYLITWFGDHYPGFRILGICLLLHISNYLSLFCVGSHMVWVGCWRLEAQWAILLLVIITTWFNHLLVFIHLPHARFHEFYFRSVADWRLNQ